LVISIKISNNTLWKWI